MPTDNDPVRPLLRGFQHREFTAEPLTAEQLDGLARVARWSGSAANSQPWRFILVSDLSLVRQVAEMAMPQTRALRTATAAMAITMPDEPVRATVDTYDEGRVAERILIGASMLGIGAGITWIRPEFRAAIHEALGVPHGRFVRTIMALGHPTEEALAARSGAGEARRPLDELVEWRR